MLTALGMALRASRLLRLGAQLLLATALFGAWKVERAAYGNRQFEAGEAAGYARAAAEIDAATDRFNAERKEFERAFERVSVEYEQLRSEADAVAEQNRRLLQADPRADGPGIGPELLREYLQD